MSQENVEIVREQFMDVNRRDWDAVMAAYDDEVVLVVGGDLAPDAGVFTGREAVGRWFGDWFRAFGKDYRFEVEETRSIGPRVVAVARHYGTGRASGAEVDQMTVNVYTLNGGKITRVELYGTQAAAWQAVGLAE